MISTISNFGTVFIKNLNNCSKFAQFYLPELINFKSRTFLKPFYINLINLYKISINNINSRETKRLVIPLNSTWNKKLINLIWFSKFYLKSFQNKYKFPKKPPNSQGSYKRTPLQHPVRSFPIKNEKYVLIKGPFCLKLPRSKSIEW